MSRLHKILLVVFCVGILICGVGTGIAFNEFSSLAYGGEKMIGEVDMTTRDLDVEFEPGENPWSVYGYYGREGVSELILDEDVPENTVRFRVTYNSGRVEPKVDVWKEGQELNLYSIWHNTDEVALFMEVKDEVLKELKEGKISSYDAVGIESVEVLVNPVHEEDVRLIH